MSLPIHVFSSGLWRLREEIAQLSGMIPRRALLTAGRDGAVAGWGHKPTAARARAAAERNGLPYIAFEDGFLRSLRPGPAQRPVAMIMDRSGIYYDARGPSDIETILESVDITPEECCAALDLIGEIARRRLSKYNHGADRVDGFLEPDPRPLVLLIDQTRGDESVAGALAGDAQFAGMMEAAVAENPGARLVAKLHPEVIAGAKAGYLRELAAARGIEIFASDAQPWAFFDHRPKVYTVSSQFGFEALLAGCPVICFGMPFYGGWGLTDDRIAAPTRRRRRRNLGELGAAVYLRYCHYFDAWRRRPIDAATAVDQLDFLRRRYLDNSRPVVGYRIARWKRKAISAMLDGPAGRPHYSNSRSQSLGLARQHDAAIAAWGRNAAALRSDPAAAGLTVIAIEDGFIRSAGLGAAFVPPMSLVFDCRGIYYDPSRPSDIEQLLAHGEISARDCTRAETLIERIVAERITKYNLAGSRDGPQIPPGRQVILVPGQVADDAAVLAGAASGMEVPANVNAALLHAARARNPEAYVIFKPHPDVEHLGRRGALTDSEERSGADHIARHRPLDALFPVVDRVETYSSLAGFEALLRGLPVTVHGMPFYAGWGLTEDIQVFARRGRRRSRAELAATALICYPRYLDPVSMLPCPPEVILDRLKAMRDAPPTLAGRLGHVMGRTVILCRRLLARLPAGR